MSSRDRSPARSQSGPTGGACERRRFSAALLSSPTVSDLWWWAGYGAREGAALRGISEFGRALRLLHAGGVCRGPRAAGDGAAELLSLPARRVPVRPDTRCARMG